MKKILLIEDDKMLNDDIGLLLSLSGYKVISSNDGKKGIEMAIKENPHLILCDIQMPNLDGYGVIHILGNNPKTSDIPFIFITGDSELESQRKGMCLGADDFLVKPINSTDLLNSISTRIAKSENLKRKLLGYKENGIEKGDFSSFKNSNMAVPLLSDHHEHQHFKKKHILYTIGQRPAFLYYIQKGKIKDFLINEEGKELITGIYSEGDFFGYTEIFRDSNYSKNAKAIEDVTLILIPKQEFLQKVNANTHIAKSFINLLSQNVTENEDILINMAYNSLRKKVARGIIRIIDKFKDTYNGKCVIDICRDDLASIVGSSQESMIRTLKEFKTERLIDVIDNGRIIVLDEEKLRMLKY